jgi:hypothetical protein
MVSSAVAEKLPAIFRLLPSVNVSEPSKTRTSRCPAPPPTPESTIPMLVIEVVPVTRTNSSVGSISSFAALATFLGVSSHG